MEKQGVIKPGLTKPELSKCACCAGRSCEKQADDQRIALTQLAEDAKKRLADKVAEAS